MKKYFELKNRESECVGAVLIFDGFANDEANITIFFHSTKWQVSFLFARLSFDAQLVFVLAKVVL